MVAAERADLELQRNLRGDGPEPIPLPAQGVARAA